MRSADQAAQVLATGDIALEVNSGGKGPVSAEWMIGKALWIKQNEPELYKVGCGAAAVPFFLPVTINMHNNMAGTLAAHPAQVPLESQLDHCPTGSHSKEIMLCVELCLVCCAAVSTGGKQSSMYVCEYQDYMNYHLTGRMVASISNVSVRWHYNSSRGEGEE